MNLYKETRSFGAWSSEIMRVFLKKQFATTAAVITASVISRITKLLAFLLPLKVILLAGSSGVPRYFPFIDPSDKMGWIIGLTISAFVSYAITLVLEALSKRWSEAGSSEILQDANDLLVTGNQQAEAQSYFTIFCQNSAARIFIAIGLIVLLILNIPLLLVLSALIVTQYIATFWVLGSRDDANPGRLRTIVQEGYGNYLSVLSSVNFLVGFLVILAPFLAAEPGGNILIAILSIVITRQVLSNLVSIVKGTITLAESRHRINALVFREHQLGKTEKRLSKTLRELFHKSARQAMVGRMLESTGIKTGSIDVQWVDSAISGVNSFKIHVNDENGNDQAFYQLKVFSPRHLRQAEYEDFLFRHISRQRLKAPEMIASFPEGPFQCRIHEYGRGAPIPGKEWSNRHNLLLEHLWSCQPPRGLVNAFIASHPLLHKRLNEEFTSRLSVAVDSDKDRRAMEEFRSRLPSILSWLESLPLYIRNPDINRFTVALNDRSEDVYIMHWGAWTLEPIGVFLPASINRDRLDEMLGRIRNARNDIPALFSHKDMMLVSRCRHLEIEINKERYKSALHLASQIVDEFSSLEAPHMNIAAGSSMQ